MTKAHMICAVALLSAGCSTTPTTQSEAPPPKEPPALPLPPTPPGEPLIPSHESPPSPYGKTPTVPLENRPEPPLFKPDRGPSIEADTDPPAAHGTQKTLVLDDKSTDRELSEDESTHEEIHEWDFVLPVIPAGPNIVPGGGDGSSPFSLRELIGAMQHGANYDMIIGYLGYYDRKTISHNINGLVEGIPAMFYVVGTNNDRIIRAWVDYGGDVNAVHGDVRYPLLTFAIINSDNIQNETTLTVATLLSLGAQASVIPTAFYSPFCVDLPDDGPDERDMDDLGDKNKQWCTPGARARLAKTLNLTQRYYLEKSVKTKKPSIRHRQVARWRRAEPLLGIHYFLIGQTSAATYLMQKLLSYMLLPNKRPLVLVFAGNALLFAL